MLLLFSLIQLFYGDCPSNTVAITCVDSFCRPDLADWGLVICEGQTLPESSGELRKESFFCTTFSMPEFCSALKLFTQGNIFIEVKLNLHTYLALATLMPLPQKVLGVWCTAKKT